MKCVVVHRGARDHYQVARALQDRDALEALVTDIYWPANAPWARALAPVLPARLRRALGARCEPFLDHRRVRTCGSSGVISHLAARLPLPFAWQQSAVRWTDATLGREAQRVASAANSAILSYSYYAYDAFNGAPEHLPRILFQLHPHPTSVREILRRELQAHPECRVSLMKEWELSLPEQEYRRLVDETLAAQRWIAASTFTKQTLVEHGIPAQHVAVVPYGVDLAWYTPGDGPPSPSGPLRLLFVGTINQRKGIRYLVEGLERLPTQQVHLTVCGRVVDDLSSLRSSRVTIDVRPNVSAEELRQQYRRADVFVLPTLAEGFGHVILEALACGLPVITTTRSAGPDLIRNGREGFVIAPGDSDAVASSVEWCLTHRADLNAMRRHARARAEEFSWDLFRSRLGEWVAQQTATLLPRIA